MKFYAVTESSVFEIDAAGKGPAVVTRIARRGLDQRGVGDRLQQQETVVVTSYGLFALNYESARHLAPSFVPAFRQFGPCTGPIGGLFVNKNNAIKAVDEDDLQTPDPRFQAETLYIIAHILTWNFQGRRSVTVPVHPQMCIAFDLTELQAAAG